MNQRGIIVVAKPSIAATNNSISGYNQTCADPSGIFTVVTSGSRHPSPSPAVLSIIVRSTKYNAEVKFSPLLVLLLVSLPRPWRTQVDMMSLWCPDPAVYSAMFHLLVWKKTGSSLSACQESAAQQPSNTYLSGGRQTNRPLSTESFHYALTRLLRWLVSQRPANWSYWQPRKLGRRQSWSPYASIIT